MPHQNRVTPCGTLIATLERGSLMGNRGCLHDDQRRIRRLFGVRRWLLCVLEFKGRRRELLRPGHYTELFFLDEATGLAAGHRPCAECQRERFRLFRDLWAEANPEAAGSESPRVDRIDAVLHSERLEEGHAKRTFLAPMAELPTGVMILLDEVPWLVLDDGIVPWFAGGYGPRRPKPMEKVRVLTPPSTVQMIARGYPVDLHPSADEAVAS
jgi:hypothetical protein